jgi:AraC family transcriptional regulator, regulatory protein of adaptative response / methylated-DNA-[protein]-cysteine methyltransferase
MNAQLNAPLTLAHVSTDYRRIERAIGYIEKNLDAQPELEDVAGEIGLSPSHFQRLFTAWAGISPKRFLQALTLAKARGELRRGASVLDATYASGLSSPGRLHDLFVVHEAMTPGEYKALGRDMTIRYGFVPTPFGEAAVLLTDRGICGLAFVEDEREATLDELMANWRLASFVDDTAAVGRAVAGAFAPQRLSPIRILMKGTPFQLKVWEALLRIPQGGTAAYDDVANAIGQTGSARAVSAAVADNRVGFLIPCHRVLRKTGAITGYHWGPERKRAMLAWEQAQGMQAAE